MPLTEIKSEDQFTDLTSNAPSDQVSVIYFQTPWADPCIQMSKVVETLCEVHSEIQFLVIDADKLPSVAEFFEVSSVPYFILIKDSTILKEFGGADPKELAEAVTSVSTSASAPPAVSTASKETPAASKISETPAPSTASTPAATPIESQDELNKRLEKLTHAAPVMVFIKGTPSEPKCGFSRQLIAILRENQVKFGFFDILKDNSVRSGLKVFSDWPTFPQLYINGEFQGGLDIVKENLQEDPDFFEHALESE